MFTQSPAHVAADGAQPRGRRALSRAPRGGRHRAVVCHAVYLVNLATPDTAMHEKSGPRCGQRSRRHARSGPRASSSTSARTWARDSSAGVERVGPRSVSCSSSRRTSTWLLLENSAGAGGTMGRSTDELAAIFDGLDHHPRLGICLDSCHWYASGRRRHRCGRARRGVARARPADRARPPALPPRQRLEDPLGRTGTGTTRSATG